MFAPIAIIFSQTSRGKTEKRRTEGGRRGKFDFVLLDTRGREPFANGHIPGAWCAPAEQIDKLIPLLPADKELVTYCWGHD
jgi:rhodanese-related sulfurtransferase